MKTSRARLMLHSLVFGTVSNMNGRASAPTCPLVFRAQHPCSSLLTSSFACRSRASWPRHGLRAHLPMTRQLTCHNTSAQHCEGQPDSHVCRRAMLAFGVVGLGLVHSAQPADAETALPTELREQSLLPACLAWMSCLASDMHSSAHSCQAICLISAGKALQGPVQFLKARQRSNGGEFLISPIKVGGLSSCQFAVSWLTALRQHA